MLCGMVPFKAHGLVELRNAILHSPLKFSEDVKNQISKEARHLIRIMLRKDPEKRATINQVLKHPWFNKIPEKMNIFSSSEVKKI